MAVSQLPVAESCARCGRVTATWRMSSCRRTTGTIRSCGRANRPTWFAASWPAPSRRSHERGNSKEIALRANCWAAAITPSSARSSSRTKVLDWAAAKASCWRGWRQQGSGKPRVEISGAKGRGRLRRRLGAPERHRRRLADYPGRAFDYVILSQTLQETRHPRQVLREMVGGTSRHRGLSEFRTLRVRLAMLSAGARAHQTVSLRVVRLAQHPLF